MTATFEVRLTDEQIDEFWSQGFTHVERITTENGRVTGVVAGGQAIAADRVLSGVDPKTTFLKLLDPLDLPPEFAAKMRQAGCTEAGIKAFQSSYSNLLGGSSGLIPEDTIDPVLELPKLEDLTAPEADDGDLLRQEPEPEDAAPLLKRFWRRKANEKGAPAGV